MDSFDSNSFRASKTGTIIIELCKSRIDTLIRVSRPETDQRRTFFRSTGTARRYCFHRPPNNNFKFASQLSFSSIHGQSHL
jgi:hypothetical protein